VLVPFSIFSPPPSGFRLLFLLFPPPFLPLHEFRPPLSLYLLRFWVPRQCHIPPGHIRLRGSFVCRFSPLNFRFHFVKKRIFLPTFSSSLLPPSPGIDFTPRFSRGGAATQILFITFFCDPCFVQLNCGFSCPVPFFNPQAPLSVGWPHIQRYFSSHLYCISFDFPPTCSLPTEQPWIVFLRLPPRLLISSIC